MTEGNKYNQICTCDQQQAALGMVPCESDMKGFFRF